MKQHGTEGRLVTDITYKVLEQMLPDTYHAPDTICTDEVPACTAMQPYRRYPVNHGTDNNEQTMSTCSIKSVRAF